jgi:hypothetical protein
MAKFKEYDRSQGLFLTVNLEEQLLPGTFEWTLDYLIFIGDNIRPPDRKSMKDEYNIKGAGKGCGTRP